MITKSIGASTELISEGSDSSDIEVIYAGPASKYCLTILKICVKQNQQSRRTTSFHHFMQIFCLGS
jgi:hypothetical protein